MHNVLMEKLPTTIIPNTVFSHRALLNYLYENN